MRMGTTVLYETDSVIEEGIWISLRDGGLDWVMGLERVFDSYLYLDGKYANSRMTYLCETN